MKFSLVKIGRTAEGSCGPVRSIKNVRVSYYEEYDDKRGGAIYQVK